MNEGLWQRWQTGEGAMEEKLAAKRCGKYDCTSTVGLILAKRRKSKER